MEPRVFTRGNGAPYMRLKYARCLLQWSHASSRVETSHRALPSRPLLARLQWSHASSRVETLSRKPIERVGYDASMEPRVFTPGNLEVGVRLGALALASMEPRVYAREPSGPW